MTATAPRSVSSFWQRHGALVLLLVLSFGSLLVAGVLRFSGWRPATLKNHGELLQPYVDLRAYSPPRVDGGRYRWRDYPRTWRIVALPEDCKGARHADCLRLLQDLDKVWRLMGREADRVHVLWGGALPLPREGLREVYLIQPDATLRSALPRPRPPGAPQGDPVWLVDPYGFVVMRYPSGFDPGDLRSDLARLLKVN